MQYTFVCTWLFADGYTNAYNYAYFLQHEVVAFAYAQRKHIYKPFSYGTAVTFVT